MGLLYWGEEWNFLIVNTILRAFKLKHRSKFVVTANYKLWCLTRRQEQNPCSVANIDCGCGKNSKIIER